MKDSKWYDEVIGENTRNSTARTRVSNLVHTTRTCTEVSDTEFHPQHQSQPLAGSLTEVARIKGLDNFVALPLEDLLLLLRSSLLLRHASLWVVGGRRDDRDSEFIV